MSPLVRNSRIHLTSIQGIDVRMEWINCETYLYLENEIKFFHVFLFLFLLYQISNIGNEYSLLINVENKHFPLVGHFICYDFPANPPVLTIDNNDDQTKTVKNSQTPRI